MRDAVGLAIDPDAGRLYFGRLVLGTALGSLERVNLDGSDRETIVSSMDVDSLAIDREAGKLYWTDTNELFSAGQIYRVNLDGTAPETLPLTGFIPGGITIVPEPATGLLLVAASSLLAMHRLAR